MASSTEQRGAMAPIEKRRSIKLGEPKQPEGRSIPSLPNFGSLPSRKDMKAVGDMYRRGFESR